MGDVDQVVLTFEDTTIFESDLHLLDDGFWLNDKIIGFFFDFLEKELINDTSFTFVNPSTSQLVKFLDSSDLKEIFEALELDQKELVFIPINNSSDAEKPGGSHWTLLVYCKRDDKFYYFDSASTNQGDAALTAAKLFPIVNPLKAAAKKKAHLHTCKTPQQVNGYDCGVYVLAIAELLASEDWTASSVEQLLSGHINPQMITKVRDRIRSIILKKANATRKS